MMADTGRYREDPGRDDADVGAPRRQRDDHELVLPAVTASVPAARLWVGRHLARHGLEQAGGGIALMVTELAANVLQHTSSGRFVVSLDLSGGIRVAVYDTDPTGLPRLVSASADAESGRGLALVEALSDAWGTDVVEHGKWVWFRIHSDPEDDDAP